jgi:superfamily I DNA/RNA helicase
MKKFIKTISLYRMRNEEHNKFMSTMRELITNANAIVQDAMGKTLPQFISLAEEENRLVEITYEDKLADMLAETDKLRDGLCRAIQTVVEAYTYSYLDEESSMAKKLKAVVDKFDEVFRASMAEKSATIYNLLHELSAYADIYNRLHLANFLKDLTTATNMYEGLWKGHTNICTDVNTIATVRDVRSEIDVVYAQMVDSLEMAMLVGGINKYSDFVIALNTHIDELRSEIKGNKENRL